MHDTLWVSMEIRVQDTDRGLPGPLRERPHDGLRPAVVRE